MLTLTQEQKATYEVANVKTEKEFKEFHYPTFEKVTGKKLISGQTYGVQNINLSECQVVPFMVNFGWKKVFLC
ncbi:MAG: hypothetical protein V7719_13505 [Psychroserpens sp.]|uniref:hypothetical protein n=1 Tax=Psychroserpens sp. TaxID=2020870 RepID=UPI003002944D